MESVDVIIVGGGIIGAACAAECAAGGLKTLVLEQECIGGGTTAAGMGHLVVMDDSEAQLALTGYSRDLWNRLVPELPAAVEHEGCGTLWVAADADEMAEVRRKKQVFEERKIRAEILDGRSLAEAEPHLRPGLAGALLVPEDGVIYPPAAAAFLLERAQARGTQVRTGTRVARLCSDGGVVLADGTRINCQVAINAAGCGAPELLAEAAVRKRKGHLVITDRYPGFVRHQLVELGYLKSAHSLSADSVAFNIQPRKTGQMLIGSSRQYEAQGNETDAKILSRMIQRAMQYMPEVGRLSAIRVWAGHRPATTDKLPLIGPSVNSERIWLATGHEGLGITTALGTGRLLADLLLQRPTAIPAAPYLPRSRVHAEAQHA